VRGERRGMAGTPRTRAVSILNSFLTQAPLFKAASFNVARNRAGTHIPTYNGM